MIEFQVQRAQPADWQRIRSIRLRSLADAPDAFGRTLAEDEARLDAEWHDRAENEDVAHFLATTRNRNCIGTAVGAPYTDHIDTAGLFAMWVAPKARGWKVGSALVDAVVSWARNENYKRVLLDVADENTVAIRLYESCGFIPTGKTSTLPPPRHHIQEHERSLSLE
jgi:GNAT superfamily N-acetyltransferase